MNELEHVPATGAAIGQALNAGVPLTDRLAQSHPALFGGNAEMQALYLDVFQSLIAEAETVPGYSVAMAMMIERYAFLWATQKTGDAAATDPIAYDKIILRFRQLWDGLLKARDDRQADDQYKHAFTTSFLRMFVGVLDEELEEQQAQRVIAKVVDRMQTIEVQGTETGRRNRS